MNFNDYIEKAKKAQGGISQNELARKIGISGASLSRVVNGGGLDERYIVRLARLSESSLEAVTFAYEADRARTVEGKAMWKKLMASAASFLVALPFVSNFANELCILCKIHNVVNKEPCDVLPEVN